MNALGEAIRTLMNRRGLTGAKLGEEIGLSATSVSRILQGHSQPKQVTLSRLMKRLCVSPEDEQWVLRAFTGVAVAATEEPVLNDPRNVAEERERVERWLEARTQAIVFKNAVAGELDRAGISYQRDLCDGIASADFVVERGGKRIVLECKYNVARDFEKTVGVAHRLLELLHCDRTVIVVPKVDSYADGAKASAPRVVVKTPAELVTFLEESA